MKTITIIRDKKLIFIWTIIIFLYVIKIFVLASDFSAFVESTSLNINFMLLNILQVIVLLALSGAIYSKLFFTVKLKSERIAFGAPRFKNIAYSDIDKVDFDTDIKISTKTSLVKIPLYNITENESLYYDVINTLKIKLNLNIDANKILKKLFKKVFTKKTRTDDKLSPLQIILIIYLISNTVSLGFYVLFVPGQANLQNVHPITVLFTAVSFVIGVLTCIFTTNKHWWAPSLIKAFLWSLAALSAVTHIESIIIHWGFVVVREYISLLVSLALTSFIAIFVSRGLDISENANNTFARERMFLKVLHKTDNKTRQTKRSAWAVLRAVAVLVIMIAISFLCVLNIIEYYSYDKNIYSSVSDLIEKKYEKEVVDYLFEDGYYLVLARNLEADRYYKRQLYWEDEGGEIVRINNWHESTSGFDYENLFHDPHLYVYSHNDNYIVIMEDSGDYGEIEFYNNYGKIMPEKVIDGYGSWYFLVVMSTDSRDNYRLSITSDGEEVYSTLLDDAFAFD